jgi:hypothetical protein
VSRGEPAQTSSDRPTYSDALDEPPADASMAMAGAGPGIDMGGSRQARLRDRLRVSSPTELAAYGVALIPIVLAAVYCTYFVVRLGDSLGALMWNSDYASGYTLTQTVAQFGSGGHTVISTTGAWAPLWFGILTAHLPFRRQLWEISPTLLFAATAAVIGWSTARVAGRAAAKNALMMILLASPWSLAIFMAPVAHNTVYPTTALVGAYLPVLLRRRTRSRLAAAALPAAAALALGIAIASDQLVIVTGVAPLVLVAVLAVMQRNRRTRVAGGYALATVAASVPVWLATNAIMKAAGYVIVAPPLVFAPLSQVPFHIRVLFRGLRDLSNGYLGAAWPGTLHAEVGTACNVILIASLLTLLYLGLRSGWRLVRRDLDDEGQLTRLLHVGFWFSSAIVVIAAVLLTTAVGNGLSTHESYYVTLIFSVAAVVAVADRPRAVVRWLVPVAVSIFAIGSIIGLKREYLNVYRPPIAADAATIVHLAQLNHATTGYAGYWDAANLTWSEHEKVLVRPLEQCANPNSRGSDICPFFLMRSPFWYVPKRRRTFLIVDPNELYVITLPTGLGTPIATYRLGPITMYVYPYDIASRLGPPPT